MKGTVVRRVPIELDKLLDEFHDTYARNQGAEVRKPFTDRIFAHTAAKQLIGGLREGKIELKTKKKRNGLEITWDLGL